jgi:hypothetical protein
MACLTRQDASGSASSLGRRIAHEENCGDELFYTFAARPALTSIKR